MNWLRKSLLLASVGYLGAATAWAQAPAGDPNDSGVTLARPQPLIEPPAPNRAPPPARAVPAFVVRGQMEEQPERSLPSPSDVAEPRVKPVSERVSATVNPSTPPATQGQAVPPNGAAPAPVPAPTGSKTFIPPNPQPAIPQYNAWSGRVEGIVPGYGPVVVYDMASLNGPPAVPTYWARAEYLLWWTKGYHLPPLVTTGSPTTPENVRGALGQPDTVVLFGGNNTSQGPQSGARFTVGWNFDPCGVCGMDASYFFLGRNNDNFSADSSQFPVLARPFFNVNIGANDRELTASPGILPGDAFKLRGAIQVNNFSELQGADVNFRTLLWNDCRCAVYGLAGFRWLDLREGLSITENVVSAAAVPGFPIFTPGNLITVNDTFDTRNQFFGGQLGLDGELRRGRWFAGARVQVGLGVTHETIDINGSQTVTTLAGARQTFTGGLLALPSNIGSFSQNRFSVVPQIGLRVGYNVTDNVRLFVGYDFLYWSNVVRPGDQVDTNINVSQIPNFNPVGGGAFAPPSNIVRPIVPFATSGYFAQGVSVGLEWRY
jgi:hypothetical protein